MLFTGGVILFFVGSLIAATLGNRRNDSVHDKVGFSLAAIGGGLVVGSITIYLGGILP
jgi:hypothetical protein